MFICDFCNKEFKDTIVGHRHVLDTHGSFRCNLCGRSWVTTQGLVDHLDKEHNQILLTTNHDIETSSIKAAEAVNKMPSGQGKRDKVRPRHDLIPLEFLDELASIFEEGRKPRPGMPEGYGDSWKSGGKDFLRDCLNHASNHLHRAMNGDTSENNLSKAAWGCLVVRWHQLKEKRKNEDLSGT